MTINCKGKLIDLSSPKIMGILNTTPDSFFSGSRVNAEDDLLRNVEGMIAEGATFIDIGGYSTRPGSDEVSVSEEISRVVPAISALTKAFPEVLISIDSFRSEVAEAAIDAGAAIINDISAAHLDENMLETVRNKKVPFVAMHMRGNPQSMMDNLHYDNLVHDIIHYFSERLHTADALGISDVILDPGFGFSKNLEQNYALLNQLEKFKILNRPILVGISRKSMIYKLLELDSEHALNGTTALHSIALLKGANILRVHDVKAALECITLIEQLKS